MRVAVSPILWHNEDIPDLMPPIDAPAMLDEIAAAGYDATEYSSLFPTAPAALRALLEPRGMRLVSAYIALRIPGPRADGEVAAARARARFVRDAGGDVLVAALDYDDRRVAIAGSVRAGDPKLDDAGWMAVVGALHEIGRTCNEIGVRLVVHNEAGTFIETADEFDELARRTDPALVALCLDVGHLTVGGGDAVAFLSEHRARIEHVHIKDADRAVIDGMRRREFGMMEALRRGVFCELGTGALDIEGLVRALKRMGYGGWAVIEQDSTHLRPLDAAKRNRVTFRRLAGV
ncbi:MAG: TIM barrel protein [Chloroflexota bacterium]|nr:TIM barrel protein [Chloroflexota bacterium]